MVKGLPFFHDFFVFDKSTVFKGLKFFLVHSIFTPSITNKKN